jgi:hypothetical protein
LSWRGTFRFSDWNSTGVTGGAPHPSGRAAVTCSDAGRARGTVGGLWKGTGHARPTLWRWREWGLGVKAILPATRPLHPARMRKRKRPDSSSGLILGKPLLSRALYSGRQDLNLRPLGPEPSALAKLSYAPSFLHSPAAFRPPLRLQLCFRRFFLPYRAFTFFFITRSIHKSAAAICGRWKTHILALRLPPCQRPRADLPFRPRQSILLGSRAPGFDAGGPLRWPLFRQETRA